MTSKPFDQRTGRADSTAVLATYLTMLAMPWLTLPNHRVPPVSSLVARVLDAADWLSLDAL